MITFYIIGVVLSILLNLLVVVVLLTKCSHVNHLDMLMVSLAISDILQSVTGYPVEIYSLINTTIIDQLSCKVAGFSITFLALVSISHLAGISIERAILLTFPWKAREWFANRWVSLYIIIPSWLYGFLWALFPLLGWSSYKREFNANHRCSIDLETPSNNSRTYAICLMCFCFLIPIVCIAVSSGFTLRELKRMRTQVGVLGINENQVVLRRKREVKHTVMALVLISTFIVAWSPYSACVFALTTKGKVEESLLTFSAIFAKTSTLYNPIVYSIFLKEFRSRCLRVLGCKSMNVVAPIVSTVRMPANNTSEMN